MKLNLNTPRQSLNKAYLKVKPHRDEIDKFKSNLIKFFDQISESESEEYHKNISADLLKDTFYSPTYFINTKGRSDLVIHLTNYVDDPVGVVLEVKNPSNKSEMVNKENLNVKAFHEILLYFLRERILEQNTQIKHLIITNIFEWYIFDAISFDRIFVRNNQLIRTFSDFENGRLASKTTDFFYKEIAYPFIENSECELECSYFDIREFESTLRNQHKDDKHLIALFKILSPEHLLKLPFVNDSNTLDKRFYSELLHIIGLSERKAGSKYIIERLPDDKRYSGSLIENAITQLDYLGKIGRLNNPEQYGESYQDRIFSVSLELVLNWINRILFLKLLEAQLLNYHNNDTSYLFLTHLKLSGGITKSV